MMPLKSNIKVDNSSLQLYDYPVVWRSIYTKLAVVFTYVRVKTISTICSNSRIYRKALQFVARMVESIVVQKRFAGAIMKRRSHRMMIE